MTAGIAVIGEALADLIVGRHLDTATLALGGGPFNVARTIGRLGQKVWFVGSVSTDRLGELLRDGLIDSRVEVELVRRTDAPTTLAVAALDESAAAAYTFYTDGTAAAALRPDDVPLERLAGARALHVGSLGLVLEPLADTVLHAIRASTEEQVVMVDPNCRPGAILDRDAYRERVGRCLARADVVKASVEDLAYLQPSRPALAAASALVREHGPTVVLVTAGADATLIVTRSEVARLAVPAVPVVDTVGAGDAFGGAFLAWWVREGLGRAELNDPRHLRRATEYATDVAVRTCGRAGAEPPWSHELA